MDSSKEWPDNVLTTKEYIMSRYPPFHTSLKIFDYDLEEYETETKGTILHHIAFSSLSNEMIVWIIQYYKQCLSVCNDIGRLPLHHAVSELSELDETTEKGVLLLNTLCETCPKSIWIKDNNGQDIFCYIGLNLENPDMCDPIIHILLDYTKEKISYHHLIPNGEKFGNIFCWWLRTILQARYRCRLAATIVEKRRVINQNKDVSWLVSRYILSTRTNESWLLQRVLDQFNK